MNRRKRPSFKWPMQMESLPPMSRPGHLRWSLLLLLLAGLALSGCQSVRGVMYLKKARVGDHIARLDKKPPGGDPVAWDQRKVILEKVPDGNRILGGFCTDERVQSSLRRLRKLKDACRERMISKAEESNLNSRVFWSLLSTTVVLGAGMIITGVAITDPEAKGWTAFSFGAATVAVALVNGLGGFDGRAAQLAKRARKIDNWMWTMRLRVIAEVCNAKSREVARQQADQIARSTRALCITNVVDDGIYRIPTRSNDK